MISSLASAFYPAHTNNYKKGRNGDKVCKITVHQMAGKLTSKQCGVNIFQSPTRKASSNYGIGYNGDIACYVEEENRAYTSSSAWNDQKAITIECSNSANGTDAITDATWNSLVNLCVDICKRYNFRLTYDGTKNASLTRHNMFANTSCPGNYIQSRLPKLVKQVNARLDGSKFKVGQRVLIDAPIGENIENDKVRVNSNGYIFEVHKSVAKVYGLGDVIEVCGNGLYKVKIFDDPFYCKEEYMSDKF